MSLTAANAVIQLTVPGVFNAPQQLQGFTADDVFDSEDLESADTMMGVDGKLSGGFVYVSFKQKFSLQADSGSISIFDDWWSFNQANQETFTANGLIILPAVAVKITLTKGFLKGYKPLPDAKKILQGQSFRIEWESQSKAPL